jgi:hypothetical protein
MIHNVDQICSISIIKKRKSIIYRYIEIYKKKSFFSKEKILVKGYDYLLPDWFYNDNILLTAEEILEEDNNLIIEDNEVYEKPHIIIYMVNGRRHYHYFNSDEELTKFTEQDLLKNIKWLKI